MLVTREELWWEAARQSRTAAALEHRASQEARGAPGAGVTP